WRERDCGGDGRGQTSSDSRVPRSSATRDPILPRQSRNRMEGFDHHRGGKQPIKGVVPESHISRRRDIPSADFQQLLPDEGSRRSCTFIELSADSWGIRRSKEASTTAI